MYNRGKTRVTKAMARPRPTPHNRVGKLDRNSRAFRDRAAGRTVYKMAAKIYRINKANRINGARDLNTNLPVTMLVQAMLELMAETAER